MNLVEAAGHLGADPETRVTPNGLKITTLRLATNSRRAGKEETIWWRVTIFGDRFDKMLMHLKKGSPLIVLGELNKPEIWMDKEGRPQITLEVVAEMLRFSPFGRMDRPQENNTYGNAQPQHNAYYSQSNSQAPAAQAYNSPAASHEPFSEPNYQFPNQFSGGGNAYNDEEVPF